MKKRILLTGTNGFIGRKVLETLVNMPSHENFSFMSLVRSGPVLRYPNVTYVNCDLKADVPSDALEFDPHIVIHMASLLKNGRPGEYREVNVQGTQKLLDCLGQSCELLIYNSSMSVYGQGPFKVPIKENSPKNPQTSLAVSRSEAEDLIQNYCVKKSLGAFILRPRFVIGAEDKSTLPALHRLSLTAFKYGSEKQAFSIVSVDDYAKIITALLESAGQHDRYEALNISCSQTFELGEILSMLNAKRPHRTLFRLPLSGLISFLSLFKRTRLLTKLELIGQEQLLSNEKLLTYVSKDLIIDSCEENVRQAIQDFLELRG